MDSTNYRENYEKSQQSQKKIGNGLGVASLVLGIIGFLTAFLVIGILFDLIAITLGIIAIVSKKQKSGLGIAGLIIASASIVLMVFMGSLFSDFPNKETTSKIQEVTQSDDHYSNSNTPLADVKNSSSDSGDSLGSIEEQVLLDKDGLKITAIEIIEDSIWGEGIKLLIENNSDKNLGVGCNALIVNNYMITDLFSSSIAAGKKANENMYFSSSQLEAAGIENIGQVEVYFHIYDGDSYETLYDSDCVTIKTSEYDSMDITAMDDGKELLNQNGIRIIGKYVDENSFWGTALLLFIENKSGKNIGVNCDNMSINGFMVSPLFSSTVYNERMSIDDITIFSSDLEENGIDKISDIELNFHIYDADSYSTIFDSEVISFSVQ